MKKLLRIALWTVAAFLFLVMIAPYVLAGGLRVVWTVLFGWLEFLKRVIPAVSVSWSGVAMVVLCSALIVGGLHWLCAWFARQRTNPGGNPARWRWSWTLALYGFLWMLFLAAMGITGFTHQVAWLARSKEPWHAPRKFVGGWRYDLQQTAMLFSQVAEEENWHQARTLARFHAHDWFTQPRQAKLVESLQTVAIPHTNGSICLAALFFRDPELRDHIGMMVIDPNQSGQPEFVPYKELPDLISRCDLSKPRTP